MRGIFLLLAIAFAPALHAGSALEAVKQLPAGEAARLARIEGRDGDPSPARWYVLVHDPEAENGIREYAIEDGKVVAARSLSQFAERLAETDVLAVSSLKFDSDAALKVARRYADSNGMKMDRVNYALEKTPEAAVWHLKCFDADHIGELTISAETGAVLAHPGFALEPAAVARKTKAISAAATPVPDAAEPHTVLRAIPVAEEPVAEETPRKTSTAKRFFQIFRGKKPSEN